MNINDQNRKHWDFYFQAREAEIERERQRAYLAFQAREADIERQRLQDNLAFQAKEKENQRKNERRILKHQQRKHWSNEIAHAAVHLYKENKDFRRFIDESAEKGVTVLIKGYKYFKEATHSESAHSRSPKASRPNGAYSATPRSSNTTGNSASSAGSPIVERMGKAIINPDGTYRYANTRERS